MYAGQPISCLTNHLGTTLHSREHGHADTGEDLSKTGVRVETSGMSMCVIVLRFSRNRTGLASFSIVPEKYFDHIVQLTSFISIQLQSDLVHVSVRMFVDVGVRVPACVCLQNSTSMQQTSDHFMQEGLIPLGYERGYSSVQLFLGGKEGREAF